MATAQYGPIYDAEMYFSKTKKVFRDLLNTPPRIVAINANAAPAPVGYNPLLEIVNLTGTSTFSWDERGAKLGCGSTQYDAAGLIPLVAHVTTMPTPFMLGVGTGSTARNDATSELSDTFKTGASTDTDIGHGIELTATIELPSIVTLEVMVGFAGIGVEKVGCVGGASTLGYTLPTDGAYFYFNPAVSADWCRVSSYVSTNEVVSLGVPAAADRRYVLQVKLNEAGEPNFYINGGWCGKGHALDAETCLCPFLTVKTLAASGAKYVYIKDFIPAVGWVDA